MPAGTDWAPVLVRSASLQNTMATAVADTRAAADTRTQAAGAQAQQPLPLWMEILFWVPVLLLLAAVLCVIYEILNGLGLFRLVGWAS